MEIKKFQGYGARLNLTIGINRMTQHQFSKQEIINLLKQLGRLYVEYPPELLAVRRGSFLNLTTQLFLSPVIVNDGKNQFVVPTEREPISLTAKVLIIVYVAILVAYVTLSYVIGNIDFSWLRGFLSR